MANAVPVLIDSATGAAITTLVSASLTPVSGTLYLVAVANYVASVGTPTLSGTGGFAVTWTQEDTQAGAAASQRLTVFRGVASSASAGVITADFGGVSQDQVRMYTLRCPTVDQTTNQGAVQSPKNTQAASSAPTLTFAAYAKVYNVAVMFAMTNQNTTWTNSTAGWSPYAVVAGSGGSLGAMFRAHATLDTNPTGTFGASGICCTVGVELAADAAQLGPGDPVPAPLPTGSVAVLLKRAPLSGVQVSGAADFLFGGGGPSSSAGHDPTDGAQLGSFDAPRAGTTFGYWRGKTQRSDEVGSPAAPSQVQGQYGILGFMLVPVEAGARTISLDCMMELDPGASGDSIGQRRPQMIVKACAGGGEVGLVSDVTVTAGAGTAWQTLTASFTAPRAGVVEVRRFNRQYGWRVWWDNLLPT